VIYVDVNDAAPPPSNLLDEAELAAAHTRRNVIIIVILAAVSAVLAIILIIAITCVNRPCCGMYGPPQYASGLGGRGSKRPPETEADQQYMEQALHLTVADGDIMGGAWGAGGPTDLHRQTGSQSPIVTTSFASPIHEGYCRGDIGSGRTLPNPRHLQHQQQLQHAVVKSPTAAAGAGAGKTGKSDQPSTNAACQMHRGPPVSHRAAEAPSPAHFAPLPVLHSTSMAVSASTPARCGHHSVSGPTALPAISLPSSFDEDTSRRQQQQQQQQQPPPVPAPLQTVEEVAGSQETVSAASAGGGGSGNGQADQVCRQIDSLFFRDMPV
uniref:Cadherin_C domain-containing protein n=1 Tax=Macrostomum lignano TaxID=282301 RepID=A0A1I8IMR9_9PLAT